MSPVRLKEQQVVQEETQEGQFQQEPLHKEAARLKATGGCDDCCCMLGDEQDKLLHAGIWRRWTGTTFHREA